MAHARRTPPAANTDTIKLYLLTGADANPFARRRRGRDLKPDEMHVVKKYVEGGMGEHWTEIMDLAVELAIDDLGLQPTLACCQRCGKRTVLVEEDTCRTCLC